METNVGMHVNDESAMDVHGNDDGNNTSSQPKKYCGYFSMMGVIIFIIIVVIIIAVAATVSIILVRRGFESSEDVPEGSTIILMSPTIAPTIMTITPSLIPSLAPTLLPTLTPTLKPTAQPTETGQTLAPSLVTLSPSLTTITPSLSPSMTTSLPSISPSEATIEPTKATSSPEVNPIQVNWNTNRVGGPFPSNTNFVLGGVDMVQYVVDSASAPSAGAKDENGDFEYTTVYLGGNFAFKNQDNLDTFLTDPARYAPRYGGYCALAMASNGIADGDPRAWSIYLNKLYINLSTGARNIWNGNKAGNVASADNNWENIRGFSN